MFVGHSFRAAGFDLPVLTLPKNWCSACSKKMSAESPKILRSCDREASGLYTMLQNAPVNSFLRSPVALLPMFALTMSTAPCFADQKKLTLMVIFFLMAIASAIVATRIPRWKESR